LLVEWQAKRIDINKASKGKQEEENYNKDHNNPLTLPMLAFVLMIAHRQAFSQHKKVVR